MPLFLVHIREKEKADDREMASENWMSSAVAIMELRSEYSEVSGVTQGKWIQMK